MSSALIQVRVDSKLKKNAEDILLSMGLKTSEAIRIFLQQTITDQALPFRPSTNKTPNQNTINAFDEVKNGNYSDSTLANFKKSLKPRK